MKKIGIILYLLFILMGFTGFIGGALITMGVVNYDKEVPLGDITGVVVDNKGHIFVGLGFYGMVQEYDTDGVFVKNWRVSASGGTFNIDLTKDQKILISTARGSKQILYDQNGKEVSKKSISNTYSKTSRAGSTFVTQQGETYKIEGVLFPSIVKSSPDRKVIVEQSLILQLMKGPFPALLIVTLGMGLNFLLRKDQIIAQAEKYRALVSR